MNSVDQRVVRGLSQGKKRGQMKETYLDPSRWERSERIQMRVDSRDTWFV